MRAVGLRLSSGVRALSWAAGDALAEQLSINDPRHHRSAGALSAHRTVSQPAHHVLLRSPRTICPSAFAHRCARPARPFRRACRGVTSVIQPMTSADVSCPAVARIVTCRAREPSPVCAACSRPLPLPALPLRLTQFARLVRARTTARCAEAAHSPAVARAPHRHRPRGCTARAAARRASSRVQLACDRRDLLPTAVRGTQQYATGRWRGVLGRSVAAAARRGAARSSATGLCAHDATTTAHGNASGMVAMSSL